MIKTFLIFILIPFLLGVLGIVGGRILYVHKNSHQFIAQKSNFTFKPPSQALNATVTDIVGGVQKISPANGKLQTLRIGGQTVNGKTTILQDETITTNSD